MVDPTTSYPVPVPPAGALACDDHSGNSVAYNGYTVLDSQGEPKGTVQAAAVDDKGQLDMIRFKTPTNVMSAKFYCVLMKNVPFRVLGGAVQVPIDGPKYDMLLNNSQG